MKKANNTAEWFNALNKYHKIALDGSHLYTTGDLIITHCNLTTLENCPGYVGGDFNCSFNSLMSLKGCPKEIRNGVFNCASNKLTSLEHIASQIGWSIQAARNEITSLHNIHKMVSFNLKGAHNLINITDNPLRECILGLVLIDDLSFVVGLPSEVEPFLQYLNTGKTGAYKAAQILIQAGYPEFAKL